MNMNCYNPQHSDTMDFRRQDSMSDMSSWYTDQGYPPCGMPPRMIQPKREANSRPSVRAPWMQTEPDGMPAGRGNMPGNMGGAPMNMGMGSANMTNAPTNAGTMPAMPGTLTAEPARMPQGQNNPTFGEKLDRFPIGMGYVPMQKWSQPSPIDEGFCRGTIFAELDLPFLMGRCM